MRGGHVVDYVVRAQLAFALDVRANVRAELAEALVLKIKKKENGQFGKNKDFRHCTGP
jgi:hypothetical protein